ncbi:MAG: MFS transporter [Actinomycetota bacterium]|nr:MAG: MFS transporter [Actinomycetota bacterium]
MGASRSSSRPAVSGERAALATRALLLLCPATFFQGYDELVLGLSLPLIAADMGLTTSRAGFAVSAIQAGSFGLLVLLPLADRVGRRPMLLWTIVGYTVATVATAASNGVAELIAFQFVARALLGTEYALATIAVVDLVPASRRGRALGLLTSMSAFGMATAGAAFLAVESLGLSWRVLFAVGAVPLAVVAIARRRLPETLPGRGTPGRATAPDPSRPARGRLGDLRVALADAGVRPRTVAAAATLSLLSSVYPTALTAFATLLVLREWGIRVTTLHPAQLAIWVGGVSGFFVAGRLADRVGRRPAAVAFLGLAALAGLIGVPADGTWTRTVGLGLVIFGLTGSTPLVSALTAEPFPPALRGRVAAVTRTAGLVGATIAPGLTGALSALTGSLASGLSLVALAEGLAVPVVLLLPEARAAGRPAHRDEEPGR